MLFSWLGYKHINISILTGVHIGAEAHPGLFGCHDRPLCTASSQH